MVTIWCAHRTRSIDRFLCPSPCGALHVRCADCDAAVGECPFESAEQHERLVARLGAQLPHVADWQVRDLAEVVQRAGHAGPVLPLATALRRAGLAGSTG